MSTVNRSIVYSLIAVVLVLLIGIAGLLGVAYYRHQRLADETIDLRRSLTQQEGQIKDLQERLEDCDTIDTSVPYDSSWSVAPQLDSMSSLHQVSWAIQ